MSEPLTKAEMYYRGWYRFKVPPVHHTFWPDDNWINWIDHHGEWLPNSGLIPYFMPAWIRKFGVSLKDDGRHYDAGTLLETQE